MSRRSSGQLTKIGRPREEEATTSLTRTGNGAHRFLGALLEHLRQALDARHPSETLEALLDFLTNHFLHLRDAGNAGERIDGCGSLLHGVALHSGLNTPSLRLEESNANITANFYIDRYIPG